MSDRPTDVPNRVVSGHRPPSAIKWRAALRFLALLLVVIIAGNGASAIVRYFTQG